MNNPDKIKLFCEDIDRTEVAIEDTQRIIDFKKEEVASLRKHIEHLKKGIRLAEEPEKESP